jgi:hypothetical protein
METNSINFSKVSSVKCKNNRLIVCNDRVIIEADDGIVIKRDCRGKYAIGITQELLNSINDLINNSNNNRTTSGTAQVSGSSTIETLTAANNTLCSVYVDIFAKNGDQYGWKRVQFDYGTSNNTTTVYTPSLTYTNGNLPIEVAINSSGNQIGIQVKTNATVKYTIKSECKSF